MALNSDFFDSQFLCFDIRRVSNLIFYRYPINIVVDDDEPFDYISTDSELLDYMVMHCDSSSSYFN